MKYIAFALFVMLASLSFYTPQQEDKPKEKWKEITCPECKGTGIVKADTGTRVIFGLMTFGLGAMCTTTDCDMCEGTGIVKQREL